jgi:hypothetical protein
VTDADAKALADALDRALEAARGQSGPCSFVQMVLLDRESAGVLEVLDRLARYARTGGFAIG